MNVTLVDGAFISPKSSLLSFGVSPKDPAIQDKILNFTLLFRSDHLFPEHASKPIFVNCTDLSEHFYGFSAESSLVNVMKVIYKIPLPAPVSDKTYLQAAYRIKMTKPTSGGSEASPLLKFSVIVEIFFRMIDPSMPIIPGRHAIFEELHEVYKHLATSTADEHEFSRCTSKVLINFDLASILCKEDGPATKYDWEYHIKELNFSFDGKFF